MNIQLTNNEKQLMSEIFNAMNALRGDAGFMNKLKQVQFYNGDTDNASDDFYSLSAFQEDICDTAQNYFYYSITKK